MPYDPKHIEPNWQQYWEVNGTFAAEIDLAKPIDEGCLRCHASAIQPVAGTRNRFLDPPFLENGIGCERCHGPGKAHIAAMRAGIITAAV